MILWRASAVVAVVSILSCLVCSPANADPVRDAQWYIESLQVPYAWQLSQGEGVKVAVVDTGVDATHPDFENAVISGVNVGSVGGDGKTDFDGHGTQIAGLVAARGRGGRKGIIGIAPRASIVPIQAGGPGSPLVPDAIDWAVDNDVKVICVALGGSPDRYLEKAVSNAIDRDVVVVAAAGNDPDLPIEAPARYPGVVAAVGIDATENHAAFSARGPEAVLAAPAVDIVTANKGGTYVKTYGTSSATAIIAGVAALVRAKYPQLSAKEVVHRMTATATDKGKPGRDDEYGFGIVNPVAALTADVPSLPPSRSAPPTSPTAGQANPEPEGKSSSVLAWTIGAFMLAAAGVGAVIAIRRATR